MIDHDQYRRALLGVPKSADPELEAHRLSCAECRAFADRLLKFEHQLISALRVPTPSAANVLTFSPRTAKHANSQRWVAVAASVLVFVLVALGSWLAVPRSSLAADVVAHMADEPAAWIAQSPVSDGKLAAILKEADMTLEPKSTEVTYANSCRFRGHVVPHLVVQTENGPVTVMVLIHESVPKAQEFAEHGYQGTIVPVPGHGSIAVLARSSDLSSTSVNAVAEQVRNAIRWGGHDQAESVSVPER